MDCRANSDGNLSILVTSTDGSLPSGTEGTLRLWEGSSGRCLRTLEGHDGIVTTVALAPDERLALSGEDRQRGRYSSG